jgi:hypothetical protein
MIDAADLPANAIAEIVDPETDRHLGWLVNDGNFFGRAAVTEGGTVILQFDGQGKIKPGEMLAVYRVRLDR